MDDDDFSTFSTLDELVGDNEIFFTGEYHATHKSHLVCLKFIKYFHQRKGIRHYLAEMGYGSAYMVNQFLDTGHEQYLNEIMTALKGTAAYTAQYATFIRNVREFNASLPIESKIVFVGIDIEHQIDIAFRALTLLLPPSSIGEPSYLKEIRSWAQIFINNQFNRASYPKNWYADCGSLAAALDTDMKNNPDQYVSLLEKNHFDFKFIVNNCVAALRYYQIRDYNLREEAVYSNFLNIYDKLDNGTPKKFYGQWGSAHIVQVSHIPNYIVAEPLAARMDNDSDSPVQGRVVSILPVYSNSEDLIHRNGVQVVEEIQDITQGVLSGLKPDESEIILFTLLGPNSPFERTCNSFFCKEDAPEVTTDFVQFILLIENSNAAMPWKD